MKFEYERDIPRLRTATRKERHTLREQARAQDPTIRKLEVLGFVLALFAIVFADWFVQRIGSESWLVWFGVWLVLAVTFALAFRGFFVTPRIRRVLTHETKAKISR